MNSLMLNLRAMSFNKMLLRVGICMLDRLRMSLSQFRSNLCLRFDLRYRRLLFILLDIFIHVDQ